MKINEYILYCKKTIVPEKFSIQIYQSLIIIKFKIKILHNLRMKDHIHIPIKINWKRQKFNSKI